MWWDVPVHLWKAGREEAGAAQGSWIVPNNLILWHIRVRGRLSGWSTPAFPSEAKHKSASTSSSPIPISFVSPKLFSRNLYHPLSQPKLGECGGNQELEAEGTLLRALWDYLRRQRPSQQSVSGMWLPQEWGRRASPQPVVLLRTLERSHTFQSGYFRWPVTRKEANFQVSNGDHRGRLKWKGFKTWNSCYLFL